MDSDDPSEVSAAADAIDRAILVRLREGDELALNDLMNRWRKPILAYLYRTVGHYETAADLAQEVFVRVYRARKRYRPKASASSYLFTIAANLARNHFRWSKRHPEATLDNKLVGSIESDPNTTDPAARLERDEESARVRAAVQRLPEKTVETRLYRARKMMKDELG